MLPRDSAPTAVRRLDYRPPAFLVDTLELTFELDPHATRVKATFDFRRNPAVDPREAAAPLQLDGEGQQQVRVLLDGQIIDARRYVLTAHSLTFLDAPETGSLTVESLIDPAANAALEGLYMSSGVFCTQCEPEGFRRITYFPDRPDVLARYTVTIIADRQRYPVLLANGNRVDSGLLPDGRHFAKWHDPFPKPTYLFALVAGDLSALTDAFVTASGRPVRLEIWSTPRNLPRCTHAMAALKHAMRWDEQRFGREYDLDTFMIFCADDFNMGAMENKGLNIFNSRLLLADAATATDEDFQSIEGVIGHEYFHNWTGNRITCRDWFQLSLKEGLTVFRDQEFSSDMGSPAVERIAAVAFLRSRQFPEDAGPMAHPVRPDEYMEINNFYTTTVYEKGAELIRMQHTLLGAERFRRGMDLYFARHDGQAVTCDDFVQAMQDASGVDLGQFRRWYAQAGTPIVRVQGRYDASTRCYTLDVAQHTPSTPGQPDKLPLHIPLAVGLIGADGRDLPLAVDDAAALDLGTTVVLNVTEPEQQFRFTEVSEAPVPSLLRGFSAPVRLEYPYRQDDLLFLATRDSDPFSRWDAAQRLFVGALLDLAATHGTGTTPRAPQSMIDLASAVLQDETSDPALLRLALTPPDLAYVAGMVEVIDVEALVGARRALVRDMAVACRALFERCYERSRVAAPYSPVQEQIAPRGLANLCLWYLNQIDDAGARALAVSQFDAADNLTDRVGALAAINDTESREREALFARFEDSWREEPLVLDKWFALQALSHHPTTLSRVRMLLEHPKFNSRNPNRVRSLLASFAVRNWACFHARDGSAYAFIADQVMMLDRVNPHVSSMLASAFNHWRRFDEPRRSLQREALVRVSEMRDLSPDVAEIVARNLSD